MTETTSGLKREEPMPDRRWRKVYAAVVVTTVLVIFLLYFFFRHYTG